MKNLLNRHSYLIVFGIPLLLISSMILLSQSSWFSLHPKKLSIGITLDLVLTVPFVYFLLIRKKAIPKITIITSFIIGLVVASIILPKDNQELLSIIKTFAIPIIELVVLFFVITKSRKIVQNYKLQNNTSLDFYDAVKLAVKEVIPNKLSSILTTEIAVLYYSFFSWRKRKLIENEFSYHQKSTSTSVIFGFILVILIETFTLHYLLSKWSVIAAWIVTFLSVYTCLQMVALLKSLSKRPTYIDEENQKLILRYGIFSEAIIPFAQIKSIRVFEKDISEDKTIVTLSPFGKLEGINIQIELFNESEFNSFYGFKRTYNSLAFFIDDKHQFINRVESNK